MDKHSIRLQTLALVFCVLERPVAPAKEQTRRDKKIWFLLFCVISPDFSTSVWISSRSSDAFPDAFSTKPVPFQLIMLPSSYLSMCTKPLSLLDPLRKHTHLKGLRQHVKALLENGKLQTSLVSEPCSTGQDRNFTSSVNSFPFCHLLNTINNFSTGNTPEVGAFNIKHSFSFHICLSSRVRNTRGSPGHW